MLDAEEKGKQAGKAAGIKEGLEKGMEKGRQAENIAIARQMLAKGLAPDIVQELTGCSFAEVEGLE